MTITVNGETRSVTGPATVADLVRMLGRDPARPGTAVARNGDVLPRRDWSDIEVANGDEIEVVTAVGGG